MTHIARLPNIEGNLKRWHKLVGHSHSRNQRGVHLQASLAFMAAQNHEDGQSGSNLAILAVQSRKMLCFQFIWLIWRPSASILKSV